MIKNLIIILTVLFAFSCRQNSAKVVQPEKPVNVPQFNADSAYSYIAKQVNFGARVPNTEAHLNCALYLKMTLEQFGAKVIEQEALLTAYNGDKLNARNIIGIYNPEAQRRVLLCSHWDSRPWSDHDPIPENRRKPVMAANDGASGVGVLLEIARQLKTKPLNIGIDIVFLDAEDYGPHDSENNNSEDAWCLGTQYWASRPHKDNYRAMYGILLDMVGAPGATFYKEYFSVYFASPVVDKIWNKAQQLGYSDYFIMENGGTITDDHYYINKIAGIPCVDIIHYNPKNENGFGSYWHTTNDTMENISVNTLQAVGSTLLNVIYTE